MKEIDSMCNHTNNQTLCRANAEAGFSLIELLIVLGISLVMMTLAVIAINPTKKAYLSDDQAKRVMDVLRDASTRALTKRRSMRVEFDGTTNQMYLYDENAAGVGDDVLVRREYLARPAEIKFDTAPFGISAPNPPDYMAASFVTTPPTNNRIWKIRFRLDGTVVNAAVTNSPPTSVTLFVWQPKPGATTNAENTKLVRAITIFGGTGAVRYWKYNGTSFVSD